MQLTFLTLRFLFIQLYYFLSGVLTYLHLLVRHSTISVDLAVAVQELLRIHFTWVSGAGGGVFKWLSERCEGVQFRLVMWMDNQALFLQQKPVNEKESVQRLLTNGKKWIWATKFRAFSILFRNHSTHENYCFRIIEGIAVAVCNDFEKNGMWILSGSMPSWALKHCKFRVAEMHPNRPFWKHGAPNMRPVEVQCADRKHCYLETLVGRHLTSRRFKSGGVAERGMRIWLPVLPNRQPYCHTKATAHMLKCGQNARERSACQ